MIEVRFCKVGENVKMAFRKGGIINHNDIEDDSSKNVMVNVFRVYQRIREKEKEKRKRQIEKVIGSKE